jgi:hypothetical protein
MTPTLGRIEARRNRHFCWHFSRSRVEVGAHCMTRHLKPFALVLKGIRDDAEQALAMLARCRDFRIVDLRCDSCGHVQLLSAGDRERLAATCPNCRGGELISG